MGDLTARIFERRERALDQKLADALQEPLENVVNLPQIEKANLINVLHINVDIALDAEDEGGRENIVSNPDSSKSKKVSKKRRRRSSMDDDDDDDDFVVDKTSEKSAFEDNIDMDLLGLYSEAPGPSGFRKSTRQAAKRANVANKKVNLVENKGNRFTFEEKEVVEPVQAEKNIVKVEEYEELEPKTNDDIAKDTKTSDFSTKGKKEDSQKAYAETISYINSKLKSTALIEHVTPDVSKIFRDLDSLPVFDMNKIKVPVTCCDPNEVPAFLKHNLMLKTISSHGTDIGSNESNLSEPVLMQKLLATKRKILKVNLSKDANGDKVVDEIDDIFDSNENSNEPLEISESSSSRETSVNVNDSLKHGSSDISLTNELPKLNLTNSGFLGKPVPRKSNGNKLKLKSTKNRQASGGLQIDHFYDKTIDKKTEVPQHGENSEELSNAIGKILSNSKSCFKVDEDNEEVKIVEEMSSPIYRRATPRKNKKLNPDTQEGELGILELLGEDDPQDGQEKGTCPICSNLFLQSELERHASDCLGN